jgi:hypothetical protein
VIESCKKDITHINWLAVDFDVVEQSVKILQNRIVKAKLAGRTRMVKKLQSLLVKSLNARILAVKRVSENKGKKTAGVDGKLLDTSIKKCKCVDELKIKLPDYKSMPLKRIEIPAHVKERLNAASDALITLDNEMSSIHDEIINSQTYFMVKANIVSDILSTIQNLYKVANKQVVIKIQDEFYEIFEKGDVNELSRFSRQLDIIAEDYRAQSVQ